MEQPLAESSITITQALAYVALKFSINITKLSAQMFNLSSSNLFVKPGGGGEGGDFRNKTS